MKQQELPRKPRLTDKQIDYCLLHMLRVPDLFEYAKQHLKPTDFSEATEMCYATLWDCALVAAEGNGGKLPEQLETVLAMEVGSRLNDAQRFGISGRDEQLITALFSFVTSFDGTKLDPVFYRGMVQDLIIEKSVVKRLHEESTSYRNYGRPVDILSSLNTYHQKLQAILSDAQQAGSTAFPENYKPKKLGKFPTNIGYFDKFMNGGQAPGEVYVLLGPTGLGKTTTGVNITVETARTWNAAFHNNACPRKKVSCFFTWEQDKERIMHRFWSYAAKIDSTRIEAWADELIELSTRGNLADYEKEMFATDIAANGYDKVDGESERMQSAIKECNETVRIFDFSGSAENPRLGEGGLDEVATALKGVVKEGYDIGVVVIDYANAAVRKMLSARGEDMKNMRLHLANFCNDSRFKIALPFNTPVWVLNQLNTESNRRAPTATQHHSFASECGNFAENAWFAFVFGTKDVVNNTCQLFCTKTRRAKGDAPPAILKIFGNICAMQDAALDYVVDPDIKQIAPKDLVGSRVSHTALKEKKEKRVLERPTSYHIARF